MTTLWVRPREISKSLTTVLLFSRRNVDQLYPDDLVYC